MKPGSGVFELIGKDVDRVETLAGLARDMPADDPRWVRLHTELFNLAGFMGAIGDWADGVTTWVQTGREGIDDEPSLRLVPPSD